MTEDQLVKSEKAKQFERGPIFTWVACAICVVIFFGLSSKGTLDSWESAAKWGYLHPGAIWEGKYWGLITSAFVHLQLWHLAFNVYWLWILGRLLEKRIGSLWWLAFVLLSAIISSGAQLAASGSTGIGASGFLYAIFGFIFAARNRVDEFKFALTRQIIVLFIAWLFICLITTYLDIFVVGNAAHFSGFLFGILVADVFIAKYKPRLALLGLAALAICAIAPVFWSPWSAGWVSRKAYNAHAKEDYVKAISLYHRSLELGEDPVWVWTNLAIAYRTINDQTKYEDAIKTLEKLDAKAAQEVKDEYQPGSK
ncbi:MAG: rhomboid family intramembrane serine protease [Acidobacteria bacterium]|nr:rhomboid family intramembrane serine protease [Acidobacteriota bacterium]